MGKRSESREEAWERGPGAESPVEMEAAGGGAAGRSFMGGRGGCYGSAASGDQREP